MAEEFLNSSSSPSLYVGGRAETKIYLDYIKIAADYFCISELKKKKALNIGANTGIGLETAHQLFQKGY